MASTDPHNPNKSLDRRQIKSPLWYGLLWFAALTGTIIGALALLGG
ncbi:hypothetical protein [Asticcacaulis sp. YBE204]|nr:hypothetical protein [Asticcacaulis sp. YBE204]